MRVSERDRCPKENRVFRSLQADTALQKRAFGERNEETKIHGNLRYPPKATPPRNKVLIRPY